jgi:hypothetical protein
MVRTFFTALTIPEQVPSTITRACGALCLPFGPAIYPRGQEPHNSLLVRDFRVTVPSRPKLLSHKIENGPWRSETEIADDCREVTTWRMFLLQLLRRWTMPYIRHHSSRFARRG